MNTILQRKDEPLIFRPTFRLISLAVIILLLIWVLLWIPGMLSSFLITLILMFALGPSVDYFERRGMDRAWAIALMMGLIVAGFVLLAILLSHTVAGGYQDLVARMDSYAEMFSSEIQHRADELERRFGLGSYNLSERVIGYLQELMRGLLLMTGATFGTILTWLGVVPVMLYFMLLDGHRIKKAMIGMLPNRYFEMSLNIHQKIMMIVGGFIRAKMFESLVVGLCALGGFLLVGFFYEPLNYAIFLAFIVGITNIIPYLGPAIGALPPLFVAIVQYVLMPQFPELGGSLETAPNWMPVIIVASSVAFAQIVDNVYLIPVTLGRSVDVHALVVLIAIILGFEMLGVTGMIISIPLASILQTLVFEIAAGIRHLRH